MRRTLPILALAGASALVLAGCSGTATDAGAATDDTVSVVTSTNVYGDLAAQVGGDHVTVTSIIDSPDKDPHEYEADARSQLTLSKAQLVIENGGGYDGFVDTMLDASGSSEAVVLNAVAISGLDPDAEAHDHDSDDEHTDEATDAATEAADDDHAGHDHGEFNEHVWYDLPTVVKVVDEIAEHLGEIDPENAADYTSNAEALVTKIEALEQRIAELKPRYDGIGVAITEPVPLYLLESMGLVNKTPEAFSEAIEGGTDAAPAVIAETEALFTDGAVALLAYNAQTAGAQTEAVQRAAVAAGVPVVDVTEILPEGDDYVSWMTTNVENVESVLAGPTP